MHFYALAEDDGLVTTPISEEVVDLPVSELAVWADALVAHAVELYDIDLAAPLGVAGGSQTGEGGKPWPELPPEWALVNQALRAAAQRAGGDG